MLQNLLVLPLVVFYINARLRMSRIHLVLVLFFSFATLEILELNHGFSLLFSLPDFIYGARKWRIVK